MLSSKIGHALDPFILKIYRFIFRDKRIHPNVFTIFGTFFGFVASACIIFEYFLFGALALLLVHRRVGAPEHCSPARALAGRSSNSGGGR